MLVYFSRLPKQILNNYFIGIIVTNTSNYHHSLLAKRETVMKIRKNIINSKFGVDLLLLLVMLFYTFLPQIHQISVGKDHQCNSCCAGFLYATGESITLPLDQRNHQHHDSETCPICTYFNSAFSIFNIENLRVEFDIYILSSDLQISDDIYIQKLNNLEYPSRAPPV